MSLWYVKASCQQMKEDTGETHPVRPVSLTHILPSMKKCMSLLLKLCTLENDNITP